MPEFQLSPYGVLLTKDFLTESPSNRAKVGVIMGSPSDFKGCMEHCVAMLSHMGVHYELGTVSAHRTPDRQHDYAMLAERRGLKVIIACAGGSAHLQGMTASETTLPVIGVAPISSFQNGLDGVYSCIRMPKGVPLLFAGLGEAGAVNAALWATRMLALHDEELHDRLVTFIRDQTENVPFSPM